MSDTKIWIGKRPDAVCEAFKKHLRLQPHQTAVRIQFRFETVWCVAETKTDSNFDLVLFGDKRLAATTVFTNGKVLVGKDDSYQTGLDYSTDALAFRNALDERAMLKAKGAAK